MRIHRENVALTGEVELTAFFGVGLVSAV